MRSIFISPSKECVYEGKGPFIFISHSHQDTHRVKEYIEGFDKAGFRIWFDNGIFTGANWPEARAQRMKDCECVIFFLSNESVNAFEMGDELRFAQTLKKRILLVYLEECILPSSLEMKCSLLQSYHAGTKKNDKDILEALCSSDLLQKCQSDAVSHLQTYLLREKLTEDVYNSLMMQMPDNSKNVLNEYLRNINEQHMMTVDFSPRYKMIGSEYPNKGVLKRRKVKLEEQE